MSEPMRFPPSRSTCSCTSGSKDWQEVMRLYERLSSMSLGIEATPRDDGRQSYSVSRPMLGHVDVLYADTDLRATRGNRGTLAKQER